MFKFLSFLTENCVNNFVPSFEVVAFKLGGRHFFNFLIIQYRICVPCYSEKGRRN